MSLRVVLASLAASTLLACGAPSARAAEPSSGVGADAGTGTAAAPTPVSRPFAGSSAEATNLIGGAVDKKGTGVQKCIREYRGRKKLPYQRVEISFGIDQEGSLLGVTLKGDPDPTLCDCVRSALDTAVFPRSHSGVITVTKTYEEIAQ